MSPYYFNLHIDSVIEKICETRSGCVLGFLPSNILAYADDIYLIAPLINSLKYLISIFRNKVKNLKLTINCKKFFLTIKNLVYISTALNLKISI